MQTYSKSVYLLLEQDKRLHGSRAKSIRFICRAYCRVDGDPKEAEQVIKDACLGGRITPNASTYHHMATLWTQHEQIHNFQ